MSLKKKLKEDRKSPFLFMEDETAIQQRKEYDEKTDQVYGYCGKKEEGHKCVDHYTFKVNFGCCGIMRNALACAHLFTCVCACSCLMLL